jgi:DNA-binding response OmpR family regulator
VSGSRVLIIDDEPAIRLLCRVNLEAEGFSVDEAGDGDSGIAAAHRNRPDAILLDVMLPGDDGFAVADRLHADPDLANVPIIFLTARADLDEGERLRRSGAAGFVTKPFNPLDLAGAVRRAQASGR